MFVYALFLILASSLLSAVENTTDDNNCSLAMECPLYVESNNTAYDDNRSKEGLEIEDETTRNWLFYQDFLRRMDLVYAYGTYAVIRIGSGVDYSLYRLVSSDENLSIQEETNTTVPTPKAQNGNGEDIAKFVASREGQSVLPQQLASRNRRKGEGIYLISKWFDKKSQLYPSARRIRLRLQRIRRVYLQYRRQADDPTDAEETSLDHRG